ncbi:hypothetical protein JG687_00009002 [Phytophthora cactorum]|uniref:Uncharacterized protein n=1 Tax=Phytophthora cactorum TaxID=29920 RepID=A0A329RQX2_9STRA|nr:hypothetical protein PC113_g2721 [Phytophthora cactorum]KAG3216464.1 hypothetical protein PC129_g12687 [Phytophthora cactorum]KAG6959049.1 hypothetical protein JG687_00009002 [Phytophthora cactorum]RAW27137.1 hypothetical protein PC110_g16461 [Phytophthora cactorum]
MRAMARVGSDNWGVWCVTGALPPASSAAGRLRASLAETTRLLADFEREQLGVSLDTYQKCCRQLITYMATHMNTSEDFVEKMETIIQASYSNRTGFELVSLVTGRLYAQYNGSEPESHNAAVPSTPGSREPIVKTDTAVEGAVAVTPLGVTHASVARLRQTCSPHVDLTVSTPLTVGRGGKRRLSRGRLAPQESKRSRLLVARNLYGAGTLDCEEKDEDSDPESTKESETETETEAEIEVCGRQESKPRVQAIPVQNNESGDGILWPCAGNPSERSPAYNQRLKAAVMLVDAENCCPPPEMECTQGCSRIRTRMCETHRTQGGNAKPCHNGMCCVWREIDTHLVRCQNSQCEFKNIVGLRQTMHDIQQHELKLESTSKKLLAVEKAMCDGVDSDDDSRSQLESKIKRLENKCNKLDDAVLLHKDRERAFKIDLNVLEVYFPNSDPNDFPSFQSHYGPRS